MKKALLLFVLPIFLPAFLSAGSVKDEKRIEEDTRTSLRPTETQPSLDIRTIPEPPSLELKYFQELFSQKIVTRKETIRAFLILLGKEKEVPDFDSQIAFLKEKGILPQKIADEFSPDEPLRKGLAAYMFCQALGIKGGLWLRLFGMNQRYALRELAFEGIMPRGNTDDLLSGKEFVLILTGAAEFLAEKTRTQKNRRGD